MFNRYLLAEEDKQIGFSSPQKFASIYKDKKKSVRAILTFFLLSYCSSFFSTVLFDQILNKDKIGRITPPRIFPKTHIKRYKTAFPEKPRKKKYSVLATE